MISLAVLIKGLLGTWIGRLVAGALAGLAALAINNVYQRSIGEKRAIAKVVEKTNETARKRNAKARKIRRNIKPSTAWKRLQSEYGSGSN